MNVARFVRITFFQNTSGQLFLQIVCNPEKGKNHAPHALSVYIYNLLKLKQKYGVTATYWVSVITSCRNRLQEVFCGKRILGNFSKHFFL